MGQEMNDLIFNITNPLSAEEIALYGLSAIISGEIIAQRIKRGMSQKQFAAFMGVSQGMVSKWENGYCNFTLESIVHIASKLDINIQSPFVNNKVSYQTQKKVLPFPGGWNTRSAAQEPSAYSPLVECEEM